MRTFVKAASWLLAAFLGSAAFWLPYLIVGMGMHGSFGNRSFAQMIAAALVPIPTSIVFLEILKSLKGELSRANCTAFLFGVWYPGFLWSLLWSLLWGIGNERPHPTGEAIFFYFVFSPIGTLMFSVITLVIVGQVIVTLYVLASRAIS